MNRHETGTAGVLQAVERTVPYGRYNIVATTRRYGVKDVVWRERRWFESGRSTADAIEQWHCDVRADMVETTVS